MLTRRSFCLGVARLPTPARAHDGHQRQLMDVDVLADAVPGQGVVLSFRMQNNGVFPMALEAIHAEIGRVSGDGTPRLIAPGEVVRFTAWLDATDLPGIFNLVLDFGADGAGPITVIPD